MPIETYEQRVDSFRSKNPDCLYCISNKSYTLIGRASECVTRQTFCWDSKKIAKKCPLYAPRTFVLEELDF